MPVSSKLAAAFAVTALVSASVLAVSTSASALPPNADNYVNATTIGASLTANFNTNEATTQSGEVTTVAETAYKHIYSTVWAKWTAPATGVIEADTDGSASGLDTSLAIFTSAKTISKAKRLAWNDDADTDGNVIWSRIQSLSVSKGTTYYFQIGTMSGAGAATTGAVELTISPKYKAPANDDLGNAITEKGTSFSISTGSYGGTLEPFELSYPIEGSLWYKWTPTAVGSVDVNMTGSFSNAYVIVWELQTEGNNPSGELYEADGATDAASVSLPGLNAGATYYLSLIHI